jgi:hypothetical protein
MSPKKNTEAWDRTRKAADQLKPFAKSAGQAANRQIYRTRAWAAPHVERSGKALQDTVAPKVSAMLSSAAERIDPAKPRPNGWRKPAGLAAGFAAAASAAAAVLRKRARGAAAAAPTTEPTTAAWADAATSADYQGGAKDTTEASATDSDTVSGGQGATSR